MATTKFYLDTRGVPEDKAAPLKIALTHKGKTVLLKLDVRLMRNQWDKVTGKISGHKNKQFLNMYIHKRKQELDEMLLTSCVEHMTAIQIKRMVMAQLNTKTKENMGEDKNSFMSRFLTFTNSKAGRTKEIYTATYNRINAFYGARARELQFEDITKEWLTAFDAFLLRSAPSRNARNIHLRNIRAVFNEAIDDEVTSFYPFRRFKIRPVATPKRSLTMEQLRALFAAEVKPFERKYIDMFRLIFFLAGINIVDLCRLKTIHDGRAEYYRAKTGRLYSIKVEPEAQEIINRYKGVGQLLYMLDRCSDYRYYAQKLNKVVNAVCHEACPSVQENVTTYWARHSWATIAASLDIPKETIAAALGHGGNTVTDIYIDFDRRKVDEANRKVINWVLYGKR